MDNTLDTEIFHSYWGKAQPAASSPQSHSLPYHCLDVAAVGKRYLECSPAVATWLAARLGIESVADLISWTTFWLALHDLGKFSFTFQGQRMDLVRSPEGPDTVGAPLSSERHDTLGYALWREVFQKAVFQCGWFGQDSDLEDGLSFWAQAVTGHHGQPPANQSIRYLLPGGVGAAASHFRAQDVQAAWAFVAAMRDLLLTPSVASTVAQQDPIQFLERSKALSWWIAGLTVLSDWIGSNTDYFNYLEGGSVALETYWQQAQAKADVALLLTGVLAPVRQQKLTFGELFPHIQCPSPLQSWADTVAVPAGPQIHLLEDVTGSGKTEAAMTLAHRILASGSADGFFIGLPTMATANAMYGRMAAFYQKLFGEDANLVLAHGQRELVESFAKSVIRAGRAENDSAQADESATQRCQSWLADHNKRSLLSQAGVGTIDQALLGVLQSKHQSLRLLGLVRKVLIVDEVHACDAYMQRTLETLLEFHARGGGSAILMSATLPQRMKSALLQAFARGCSSRAPQLTQTAYPLASAWVMAQPDIVAEQPMATRPDVQRTLAIRYISERGIVVRDVVAALQAGQCVAWIRNTIGDALEAVTEISAHVPSGCITLFHARFGLGDRLDLEEKVLTLFGEKSTPSQRRGQLLIATQVAEQSLDVDFDWLVTDIAPIDRVIQRAGRLRRHVRNSYGERGKLPGAKDQRGEPCLWIYGPAWTEQPTESWLKSALPKAAFVYADHAQVWRSAKALQASQITMPDDGRRLIEDVFGDLAEIPVGLMTSAVKAEGKGYSDAGLAAMNGIKFDTGYARSNLDWAADTVAPSRLGEDMVEVLLARWAGDDLVPWYSHKAPEHAWAYSTLRLPKRLISQAVLETQPHRQSRIDVVKATLPGGGKWLVLLPLQTRGGRHYALATRAQRQGKLSPPERWEYDSTYGLRLNQENEKEKA